VGFIRGLRSSGPKATGRKDHETHQHDNVFSFSLQCLQGTGEKVGITSIFNVVVFGEQHTSDDAWHQERVQARCGVQAKSCVSREPLLPVLPRIPETLGKRKTKEAASNQNGFPGEGDTAFPEFPKSPPKGCGDANAKAGNLGNLGLGRPAL